MTVNEVLKKVIPTLEAIKVPVGEMFEIGVPIKNAVLDLTKCVEFMDLVEQEAKQKQQEEPEPAQEEPETAAEREEGAYE